MVPLFSCMSAKSSQKPYQPKQKRRRLQKANPGRISISCFCSCKVASANDNQSCFSDDAIPTGCPTNMGPQLQRYTQPIHRPKSHHEVVPGRDSLSSIYSVPSSPDMSSDSQEKRRSKTPVFFVGQLEGDYTLCEFDTAKALADEYQAVLPLRLKTTFIEPFTARRHKTLRKIKCQSSLRDLVKQHSRYSPSTPCSDAETLVGSPTWPQSPNLKPFSDRTPSFHELQIEETLPASDPNSDIGLRICTELLTTELANSLVNPDNREGETGLRILLMIEAYEGVLEQVRRMLYDTHVTGKQFGHVRAAEGILEH